MKAEPNTIPRECSGNLNDVSSAHRAEVNHEHGSKANSTLTAPDNATKGSRWSPNLRKFRRNKTCKGEDINSTNMQKAMELGDYRKIETRKDSLPPLEEMSTFSDDIQGDFKNLRRLENELLISTRKSRAVSMDCQQLMRTTEHRPTLQKEHRKISKSNPSLSTSSTKSGDEKFYIRLAMVSAVEELQSGGLFKSKESRKEFADLTVEDVESFNTVVNHRDNLERRGAVCETFPKEGVVLKRTLLELERVRNMMMTGEDF